MTRSPSTATHILGALSVASGAAMLLAPQKMGRLYALPPRPGLLRALGGRDVVIGVAMLSGRRSANAARALADLADAGLIWWNALSHGRGLREFGGRFLGAIASASIALLSARRLH